MGIYYWKELPELCFTANTAGSTVQLTKSGSPTSVTLETSTDYSTRTTYTIGSAITLTNAGDNVWFRNTSTTDTGFSTSSALYYFAMTGSISASGDITYLLNKNGTDTVSLCAFKSLFMNCTALTTCPNLASPTSLGAACYRFMFNGCTGLTTLPYLPATNLAQNCYASMFYNCSNIKLSTTQTGEYQTAYRIPTIGTGTVGSDSLYNMFYNTGGTFTGTPSINTTYYTSNTLV